MMDELRILLERFWILRDREPALYHRVRRAVPSFKKFLGEQLGWKLIISDRLIKLEKIPAHAEPSMGIRAFEEPSDYCLLSTLLIFLEDKDEGERFLLSELTPAILAYLRPLLPDWSWETFSCRKGLVRVLRYTEDLGLLKTRDGAGDQYSSDRTQEVLYENTGLSRWFAVAFGYDITDCDKAEDFERDGADGSNPDRGMLRTRRVYRQLALSPAVYWTQPDDPVSAYIKNQRGWIQHYLEQAVGGTLQVYRNGAFFVLDENEAFGEVYPADTMLSDISLRLCDGIRQGVFEGTYERLSNDGVSLSMREFIRELEKCRMADAARWNKQYREMSFDKLTGEMLSYMEYWQILTRYESGVMILPAAGKMTARYSTDGTQQEV